MDNEQRNNMEKSPKVVLIIGNGFDVDLGLPTKYIDYVNSDYFKPLISKDLSSIVGRMDFDVMKSLIQLHPNRLAQYISDKSKERNWVDIEIDIDEFCKKNEFEMTTQDISRELLAIKYTLYCYFSSMKYDATINKNRNIHHRVAYNILSKLKGLNVNFQIFNFNYTSSCEDILRQLGFLDEDIYSKCHFMHGSIRETHILSDKNINFILGTCYSKEVLSTYPPAIKSLSKVDEYKNRMIIIKRHLQEADNILFVGHSAGVTDAQYFRDLFTSPNNLTKLGIINYGLGIDSVLNNLNLISDGTIGKKQESGGLEYVYFDTQGYYETLLGIPNKHSKEELSEKLIKMYQ